MDPYMGKNLCRYWPSLCFRKHEDCEGCIIFWGHGGLHTSKETLDAIEETRKAYLERQMSKDPIAY